MTSTRTLTSLLAALAAVACFAQPAATPAAKPGSASAVLKQTNGIPPRAMSPAMRSNLLARTGGIIQSPAKGPAILFLNTQKKVPSAVIREPVAQLEKILRLPFVLRDQPAEEPVAEAVKALGDPQVAAVIVIGDSASSPSLLLAPENRWALVNVAALGGSGVSAEQLADRVQKETVRAFGMLMGAAYTTQEGCVLKPVLKPEDLDALKAKYLGMETLSKISSQAQRLGVQPSRTTTYRKAVESGWAPAPTNDVQRAIWQKLGKTPPK